MRTGLLQKRWLYVLVAIAGMFCAGASYSWGVFVAAMEKEFGLLRSETSLAFSLNLFFYVAGIMAVGCLARKLAFARLVLLGGILIGAGFATLAYATSIWQVYLCFSCLCGLGAGITYNGFVSSVPQWFPEKAGLITGILLVGYGLSSVFFGPLAVRLMAQFDLAGAFLFIGALAGGVVVCSSFCLKVPSPQQKSELPQARIRQSISSDRDIPTRQMLKTPEFWLLFVILGCVAGCGLIVINHLAPVLSEELLMSSWISSLMVSVAFIFNALGRLCSGWSIDNAGVGVTLLGNSAVMLLAMCMTSYGLYAGAAWLVVAGCSAVLFTFGANASLLPNSIRALFGQKYFPLNYSILNWNGVWTVFFPAAAGLLQTWYGGYKELFLYLVAMALLVLCLTLILVLVLRRH